MPIVTSTHEFIAIKGTRISINRPLNTQYDSVFARFLGDEFQVQFKENLNDNLNATIHYFDSLENRYYNYWIDRGQFTTASGMEINFRKRLFSAERDELVYFFGDSVSSCEIIVQLPKYDGYYTRIVELMMSSLVWNREVVLNPFDNQLFKISPDLKNWNLVNYKTNKFVYTSITKKKPIKTLKVFMEQYANQEKYTIQERMAKELQRWTNEGWTVLEMKLEESTQDIWVAKYALCASVKKGEETAFFYRGLLENSKCQVYLAVDFKDELEFPLYDYFYRKIQLNK